jgi:tetratricopeptide (TPR) repeat protein
MKSIDYNKVCFIVMPFGVKEIDGNEIDFDFIYSRIFEPAVSSVELPEGGKLIPKRTDKDFFSGDIALEMFSYIEYSRFTVADITGLNANVMYELGVRHHGHQSGTALFRQPNCQLPFDISHIKAFPYEYYPESKIRESIQLVEKVLTDSLYYNRIDSPVRIALAAQQRIGGQLDKLLRDAENAIRNFDDASAISLYKQAISHDIKNPTLHLELGLLHKKRGEWDRAKDCFEKAVQYAPSYSDAFRELGIAENKIFMKSALSSGLPTGELSLMNAISFNNQDFDAYSSLGGIYKRQHKLEEAWEMYKQATVISNGHPYPFINEMRLQVVLKGVQSITTKQKFALERLETILQHHVKSTPPYDTPWCFFNLSDIYLFTGRINEAIEVLNDGKVHFGYWEVKTHRDTLLLMCDTDYQSNLSKVIGWLENIMEILEPQDKDII